MTTTDADGNLECPYADVHARFTPPGAGRIDFLLVREEGKLRIAQVGGKIRPDV